MTGPRRSRARAKPRVIALLVLFALVAPAVTAQVVQNPVRGNFEHTYAVNGRVVDRDGWPVDQLKLSVFVTGLRGASMNEPLEVLTNCNGDFGAVLSLGTIAGDPRVTVRIKEENPNVTVVQQSQELDTFHRRNDFIFKLEDSWPYACPEVRSYWPTRMTAWGRVVEGVGEHTVNGTTLESRAVPYWPLNLTITTHNRTWPPDSVQPTDERGDFKYSWTFDGNLTEGHVDVEVMGEHVRAVIDTSTRVAFFKINVGEPPSRDTPAPGLVLSVGALAAAVLVAAWPKRLSARKR